MAGVLYFEKVYQFFGGNNRIGIGMLEHPRKDILNWMSESMDEHALQREMYALKKETFAVNLKLIDTTKALDELKPSYQKIEQGIGELDFRVDDLEKKLNKLSRALPSFEREILRLRERQSELESVVQYFENKNKEKEFTSATAEIRNLMSGVNSLATRQSELERVVRYLEYKRKGFILDLDGGVINTKGEYSILDCIGIFYIVVLLILNRVVFSKSEAIAQGSNCDHFHRPSKRRWPPCL